MKVFKYIYNPEKKGVFRVSPVDNPANNGDCVLMSAQEIKGLFYAPVLIPNIKIPRLNDKGEKYLAYFDEETIEQLMFNYMKQGGNLHTNIEHADENTEDVYPVEVWTVQDSANDKSNSIGLPNQVKGTWMMGLKCDNPDVLEQFKSKLINGLSIEGHLDMEEDTDNPITKFNKIIMKKPLLQHLEDFKAVIMAAIDGEKEPVEEKPVVEEAKEEMAEEVPPVDPPAPNEPSEVDTLKATIEELEKKNATLEAELATFKNDATLMSEQLEGVKVEFEKYKTIKMSSEKLGDIKKPDTIERENVSAKVAAMRENRI